MIDALWRTVGCTVAHRDRCTVAHSGLHCGAHWVALWRTVGYTVAHSGLHLSKFTIDTENPNFLILAKIVNIYKIYKCLEERRLLLKIRKRKLTQLTGGCLYIFNYLLNTEFYKDTDSDRN